MNTKTQIAEAPADLTGTQLITLDPDKYVAAVFAPFRERLDVAKSGAKDIKAEVGTKEGMLVAIKQRALFRSLRIELDKERELRKAPILKIGNLLQSRFKELLGEITPEEDRFDSAIKAEETRKERERAEKEAAELARVTAIQANIAEIVAKPGTLVGKPSEAIKVALDDMRARNVAEWSQEFQWQADEAKGKAVAALELMHAGTLAQEEAAKAEAARIVAERAELDRLRAEAQQRAADEKRLMDEAMAKRLAEEKEARERIEAEQRASREKIEAEERAARKVREEADAKAKAERELAEIEARRLRDEEAARQKAIRDEQEKAWAEKQAQEQASRAAMEAEAERLAKVQAEEAARLRAAQEALEAEKREVARRQEEVLATDRLIGVLRERIKGEKRYAIIAKAIEVWYAKQEENAA